MPKRTYRARHAAHLANCPAAQSDALAFRIHTTIFHGILAPTAIRPCNAASSAAVAELARAGGFDPAGDGAPVARAGRLAPTPRGRCRFARCGLVALSSAQLRFALRGRSGAP